MKSKIKQGDVVKVISGSKKGEQGPITKISKDKSRVWIEGINGVKHFKPTQNDEGGIRQIPVSIHSSNVSLLDAKDKNVVSKIGYKIENGKKVRVARKSDAIIK